jgi:hypothetical protein
MNTRVLGIAVSLGLATMLIAPGNNRGRGDEKSAVPASVAVKIVDEDSKEIRKILTADKVRGADRRRAMVSAMVVATVANNNAKDPQMAAVRDQAVQLLDALQKDDSDAAKEAAVKLVSVKPAGPGKTQNLGLEKYLKDGNDYDRDTTMQLFKSTRIGGLGIETMIQQYAKTAPSAKEMDKIMAALYRVQILTEVVDKIAPEGKAAKWGGFTKALKEAVADATAKKRPEDLKVALDRVDGACAACHAEFKNKPKPN